MRTYKRLRVPGGCYFFTVNLAERQHNDLLIRHVNDLRAAFGQVRSYHPFTIDAIVILPEHLHCIWQLPPNDHDYSARWRLIKSHFFRSIPDAEFISRSRLRKQERGIWLRRYWEHWIRDDQDYRNHFDYIHYNPVKHAHIRQANTAMPSARSACVHYGGRLGNAAQCNGRAARAVARR